MQGANKFLKGSLSAYAPAKNKSLRRLKRVQRRNPPRELWPLETVAELLIYYNMYNIIRGNHPLWQKLNNANVEGRLAPCGFPF